MSNKILRVDGRRADLPLFVVRNTETARDRYDRLWVKGNDRIWRCYGSLVQRQGVEKK
jgi:hypothetical protein